MLSIRKKQFSLISFARATRPLLAASILAGVAGCGSSEGADAAPSTEPSHVRSLTQALTGPVCGTSDGGVQYVEEYRSGQWVWCVDPSSWAAHSSDISPFFAYGDAMMQQLEVDYGYTMPDLPWVLNVHADQDGAIAGFSSFNGSRGIEIVDNAFWNIVYAADGTPDPGFFGYLLTLHETANGFNGARMSIVPSDWWADSRSPFPNSVDWRVLGELGRTEESAIQKARFRDPTQDDYDPQVQMFDDLFATYGWAGFRHFFDVIASDRFQFDSLRDPPNYTTSTPFVSGNPSKLLTEYVIAYMDLGFGTDVTNMLVANGVGQKPLHYGASDPTWVANYTPSSQEIAAIADDHCSLAAATVDVAAAGGVAASALAQAETNYHLGDFTQSSVAGFPGHCGSECPSECGCSPSGTCVAAWTLGCTPGYVCSGPTTAKLTVTTDWGTGYCANVVFSNGGTAPTRSWSVAVDLGPSTTYTTWNGTFSAASGAVTATPSGSWNAVVSPGATDQSIGFCANRAASTNWVPYVTSVSASF